uniref:Uncharacterized protein n=1 Tax=Catagonus wagneri TaxID=51154 RepID=A0A8C3X102_9CETA
MILKILIFSSLCLPFKMPQGKKAKGKKLAPAPAIMKKHDTKKVVNSLFEKRPKNSGIGQDIQPKRTSPILSNGPTTLGYIRVAGPFSINT